MSKIVYVTESKCCVLLIVDQSSKLMYSEGYPACHAGVGVTAMNMTGSTKFGIVVAIDLDSFCSLRSLHFIA